MSYRVVTTPKFEKNFNQLSKKYISLKEDLLVLIDKLAENPRLGDSLGNSCYKFRLKISSKNKGKSAGSRVITHVYVAKEFIYLLAIYDKSEIESLSQLKINELLSLIEK
jgi:mRNA-degrading endonuclease RelE of RelBE toxin-antitoxin system